MMKLYQSNLSNYATKNRIAIYDKGLTVDFVDPPGGLHSPEYQKINPLDKIPCLDANGVIIPESEIINEYLEEKFPEKPLMPKSPEARAKVRLFGRFHDLYLEPPLRALFGQMNPKTRDDKLVNDKLTEVNKRLDELEKMLGESGFAAGADFTLADCAIAPTIFFCNTLLPMFGAKPALEGRAKIAAWWTHVQTRPSVKKGIGEMQEALAAMNRK
jgi:glutathione S-transferase